MPTHKVEPTGGYSSADHLPKHKISLADFPWHKVYSFAPKRQVMSSRNGPIIIIEDDIDDQEMFRMVLGELKVPNKLKIFDNCPDALNYLMDTTDKPFLIISDINLPSMSGMEMRRRITESARLRKKCIPFVFLSTSSKLESVETAYELMVQGYFTKPNSLVELKEIMRMIVGYWKVCKHPNID
jgi:CheY-like chemotaxis protein